jgi:hypothetical protein
MTTSKIFALEGEWNGKKLEHNRSIEPMLRYMEASLEAKYIFRKVNTKESLTQYLKLLGQARFKQYKVVYFAFHGEARTIWLDDKVSVDWAELAGLANGALEGRAVHFGSCQVMRTSEDWMLYFKEQTGAASVSGFSKTVDFLHGTLFDVALLYELSTQRADVAMKRMQKNYAPLCEKLGFKAKWEK